MGTFALKIALTPLLILAASLASRRWGETVGGWLVGLPLTSGPVAFFLTLEQGPAFARQAAAGSLAGTAAQACFAVAYYWVAGHAAWPVALCAATLAFVAGAAALQFLILPYLVLFVVALAVLTLGLKAMPPTSARRITPNLPLWDIPARMAVATALVVCVTEGAVALGPRLSGVLATFPIFGTVLAVFAHHTHNGMPRSRCCEA